MSSAAPYLYQTPEWQPMREYTSLALSGDFTAAAEVAATLDPVRAVAAKWLHGKASRFDQIASIKSWAELVGMSGGPAVANGQILLLATVTMEFLREGRYPGSVEVASAVLRVGGSSYVLAQAAFQDQACIALADCVMVKASPGGPVPLTGTERDLLAGLAFRGETAGTVGP
jgi:acyl-CoA thioesterase FadM